MSKKHDAIHMCRNACNKMSSYLRNIGQLKSLLQNNERSVSTSKYIFCKQLNISQKSGIIIKIKKNLWLLVTRLSSPLKLSNNLVTRKTLLTVIIAIIELSDLHLLTCIVYFIECLINTCLSDCYILTEIQTYSKHESNRLRPIQRSGRLSSPCSHHSWTQSIIRHHRHITEDFFSPDLHCQSNGQFCILLWLGGGLQWLPATMLGRPRDAATPISHRASKDFIHPLSALLTSATMGRNNMVPGWTGNTYAQQFCHSFM